MWLYSYHAYFILLQKSEKCVTEINKRLSLWSLFIDKGNKFLIPADWIIENDLCQILCVIVKFSSNREGLDCYLSKVSKKGWIGLILTCPKLSKWISNLNCSSQQNDQFENLYISSHGEARSIKFDEQVNIQRVQLGILSQVVGCH